MVIDGARQGEEAVVRAIIQFKPNLVGISCLTPGRHQVLSVAALAKKLRPGCKTVLGGIHPTLMWQQLMQEYPVVDFIVRGEGEVTLDDLVKGKRFSKIDGLVWRKRNGCIIHNPDRKLIEKLDTLPPPAWDLIDPHIYPPWGQGTVSGINLETEIRYPIIFSRGCMGRCTFCSSWKVWSGYRFRSGKRVADEMEMLVKRYGAKHFVFYDDTLTGNRQEIINFCREIVKRKLHVAIHATTRVDRVDGQLLRFMKRAGFYEVSYGIESGSPDMLVAINKRTNLDSIVRAAVLTKKAHMRVCALIMYGLPRETKKDRRLTEKLLRKIKPDSIGSIGEVWVFPGTALYEQAKNAGLIRDDFWLSRKPYYIYRGGIGGDPVNWMLRTKDAWTFAASGTPLEKPSALFFVKMEHLRRKIHKAFTAVELICWRCTLP